MKQFLWTILYFIQLKFQELWKPVATVLGLILGILGIFFGVWWLGVHGGNILWLSLIVANWIGGACGLVYAGRKLIDSFHNNYFLQGPADFEASICFLTLLLGFVAQIVFGHVSTCIADFAALCYLPLFLCFAISAIFVVLLICLFAFCRFLADNWRQAREMAEERNDPDASQ